MRNRVTSFVLLLALLLAGGVPAAAQTGTVTPTPYQTVFDSNGDPVSGAKIYTYLAGTTTLVATYTDAALAVANANPILADSSGRWLAYLSPGASYKFVIQTAAGAAIRTVDNVAAVPRSSASLDLTGTAGESLTAGLAVYLSDGSGAKTAGSWYKADNANTYSSSLAVQVGMTTAAIASGASGAIRTQGQVTGLTSLVIGTTYYIGTNGALTATIPTNVRLMGIADTTTSIVLAANPAPSYPNTDNSINDFRLTLSTGVPVTGTDVTAATTLYLTPAGKGNRIALFDTAGTATIVTSAQVSIAVPASTATTYDVFGYSNSGVLTLELLAWRNSGQAITGATNATPIVITANAHGLSNGDEVYVSGVGGTTAANGTWTVANIAANTFELSGSVGNGVYTAATGYLNARASTGKLVTTTTGSYTKTADLTRRYLGCMRTTAVSGQTEDSAAKRYVWNAYNQETRALRVTDATASWNYTGGLRQARATATNQVDVVVGLAGTPISLRLLTLSSSNTVAVQFQNGIGEDSTTVVHAFTFGTHYLVAVAATTAQNLSLLDYSPGIGRHFYAWLEYASGGTSTWFGTAGGNLGTSGISGWVRG